MIQLRPHQVDAADALLAAEGRFAHAEVTVSGGKSLIMAEMARRFSGRILILAHTAELVKQNIEACKQLGVHAVPCARTIGVNAFGRVIVGTIQTVVRRLNLFSDVALVIVDETHLVPPEEQSQYRRLFAHLPNARIRGVTGTPYRADGSGSLEDSFGPCVFRFTFAEALALGYVKPLRQIDAEADDIDTFGVKVKRGEWDSNEIAHRGIALAPVHAKAAVKALREERRKRTLVFACDIEHANALAREFNAASGRRIAASVHSELDQASQDQFISDFRKGYLPVIASVAKFAVGFNVPEVDSLVLCRPVRSRVYYVQALGRGARKTAAALDCVVVDFGGNVGRHGELDMVKPVGRKGPRTARERDELQKSINKTCKACGAEYAEFFETCPHCGHDPRLDRSVGSDLRLRSAARELLSEAKTKPQWFPVKGAPARTSNRHWRLPLDGGHAIWWPQHMPPEPAHAYVEWSSKWGFTASAVIDGEGNMHQA